MSAMGRNLPTTARGQKRTVRKMDCMLQRLGHINLGAV